MPGFDRTASLDRHLARHHRGGGAAAALEKPALDHQRVQADPLPHAEKVLSAAHGRRIAHLTTVTSFT